MIHILIGVISGIFSGVGMGGGTILVYFLTSLLGIDQHTAQATNLIFFIPTSIAAILINFKNRKVDLKLTIIISFFGIIGAVIGAQIANKTNLENLRKYFGYFLVFITLNEIYMIIKEYIKDKKEA